MPGPTTESLAEDMKEVKAELHALAIGLAELRAEVRITLGIAKYGAGLLIATVLGAGVGGVWWAANLTAEVRHQGEARAAEGRQGRAASPDGPTVPAKAERDEAVRPAAIPGPSRR